MSWQSKSDSPFYANITSPNICTSPQVSSVSYSYIGLEGDNETTPNCSFFWYFEAEDAKKAPVILKIGGGPGTSGMLNSLAAQGPCLVDKIEQFQAPIGGRPVDVGASYRTLVNNSRSMFFLTLFTGGSYGGVYIPHIATVIHEQNIALAAGKDQPGATRLNLESMLVSNPVSVSIGLIHQLENELTFRKDVTSHYEWLLETRCYNVDMYNASTCAEMFEILPTYLKSIQFAQQIPEWSVERHVAAQNIRHRVEEGDTRGTVVEDVRKKASVPKYFTSFIQQLVKLAVTPKCRRGASPLLLIG
ncbi:Alpha/Beta hydrolase protein [Mycena galopus ATCC 62051]|nr:Alpha/Beta hydrolase protein [Mycena galopus ATCC 62051]